MHGTEIIQMHIQIGLEEEPDFAWLPKSLNTQKLNTERYQ